MRAAKHLLCQGKTCTEVVSTVCFLVLFRLSTYSVPCPRRNFQTSGATTFCSVMSVQQLKEMFDNAERH